MQENVRRAIKEATKEIIKFITSDNPTHIKIVLKEGNRILKEYKRTLELNTKRKLDHLQNEVKRQLNEHRNKHDERN